MATSRCCTGWAMSSGGLIDVIATARISIPCFWQFWVRLLTRSLWNFSRSSPLMNWPPESFDPPIRQSERLSGVMILEMISSSIDVAVEVLVVLDEDLGDLVGQDPELDHAVERDREAVGGEEVHLAFLAEVEPLRPAVDQADPGLVGVEVIGARLERRGLDAPLAGRDEEDVGLLGQRARQAWSRPRGSPRGWSPGCAARSTRHTGCTDTGPA